jgi:hypothetical protein
LDKNAGVYFSLSSLSVLLRSVPNGSPVTTANQPKEIMVVTSDTDSPYYEQLTTYFNKTGTTVDFKKMSQLTVQNLNEFASGGGYLTMAALDTLDEFNNFGKIVGESNFSKQVMFIELTQPDNKGLRDLQGYINSQGQVKRVSDIQAVSSGVCINATGYDKLNSFIPYEKCAAALTITWRCWEKFKEAKVLSMNVNILNNEGEV